ncbi:MAG: pilus assembly protein [Pseudolabrys sp.]|nr:pilus assembly protein [Pseudolabrys sp.]MDP2294391.1 pilus assembly protein [Pseudolabrys sp.]
MHAVWTRIARHVATFRRANAGNVAMTFALATLPLVGTVGFAVDYSHANSVKAAMQAALDSTALMLSRDAATLSTSDLQTKAKSYFDALFTRPEAKNVAITATYTTTGGSQVKVDGVASVPTSFLGVIGYQNINVNGTATAAWGSTRLRVALALDNTGSMASDGKMSALKAATKSLLTQLKDAAAQNGDVYVSIIPFAKDVNVGSSNYSANWIDWDDWEDANGSWQNTTTCTSSSKRGKSRCSSSQTWVPANKNTWNGCVTDRDQSYDQLVTAPNPADGSLPIGQASTLFPAEQYNACPVAMMGLNYNWTSMNSLVDSMQSKGATNQPIGLVWAWQSLVGGGPLTVPPKDSNYKYQDVIVLMSDGLNTQDRWYGNGYQTSTAVDDRMYQSGNGSGTCANIKKAGVTIYTVHVNTDGDPMSTLLQNCAGGPDKFSDPSKFFMVTSANGLGAVFSAIGTNLTKLRVAK